MCVCARAKRKQVSEWVSALACVCVCVRARVRVCVRACVRACVHLFLSLSLSLTHTHKHAPLTHTSHTHTNSLSLTHTCTHYLSLFLSLSLSHRTRDELSQTALRAGAIVTTAVSNTTDILVAASPAFFLSDSRGKVAEAEARGVEVWDEAQFQAAIDNAPIAGCK